MKIEPIPNGNLRIWLSQEELAKQGEGRDVPTRVRRMVQAVQTRLGRTGKRVLAELFPVADGWILLLSARKDPFVGGPMVYHVDGVRALFCLAERWTALSASLPSHVLTSLYEVEEGYYLVVYPTPPLERCQVTLLQEFVTLIGWGDAVAAYAAERGRLLAAGDALERLVVTAREPHPPTPSDREN